MAGGSTSFTQFPQLLLRAVAPAVSSLRQRLGAEPLPLAGHVADLPVLVPGIGERARAIYGSTTPQSDGFEWLADLQAANLDLHRVFARKLVRNWQHQGSASGLDVVAARLLAFARHGGFLLHGASAEFRSLLQAQVAADIRRMTQAKVKSADQAVLQSASVLSAAICHGGPERLRDEAAARLGAAADAVILADGGHASRRPALLVETLSLLVPVRQLMASQRIAMPQALLAAIERAMPMLRMLCHGDDGLSLLQGGGTLEKAVVQALVAGDSTMGRVPNLARQSGYARLALGATTVLADFGPKSRCDGTLALEFADGPSRIFGPCGFPAKASPAWATAAANIAAQSALHLETAQTAAIDRFFAPARKRGETPQVTGELITSPHGMLFKGQSSRHAAVLGLRHHRELFLSSDGHDFRGEDRLVRTEPLEGDWPEAPSPSAFISTPMLMPG